MKDATLIAGDMRVVGARAVKGAVAGGLFRLGRFLLMGWEMVVKARPLRIRKLMATVMVDPISS